MQVNVVIVAGIIPADKGWFGMAYLNERFQIFGMHLLRVYKSDALLLMATSRRPLLQTKLAL